VIAQDKSELFAQILHEQRQTYPIINIKEDLISFFIYYALDKRTSDCIHNKFEKIKQRQISTVTK
jgi:hypothetical protein